VKELSTTIVTDLISTNFVTEGWVNLYGNLKIENCELLHYPCLIDNHYFTQYSEHEEWKISPGSEGRPSIGSLSKIEGEGYHYQSFNTEGIEPLIYVRDFILENKKLFYIDISEEFILYFNLYEEGTKEKRKYSYVDELGELEEVILINDESVKVKLRFMTEYLAIRKMHLSICFDFREELNPNQIEKNEINNSQINKSEKFTFTSNVHLSHSEENKVVRFIHGKSFLKFSPAKVGVTHYVPTYKYVEFITGYDSDGEIILESCKRSKENSLKLTFFKKDVLDKYYSNTLKYEVNPLSIQSDFFILRIDNNIDDYIPVFLTDLGRIPYKEQLYWKRFNITPRNKISNTFYDTMIEGKWVQNPETPDLYFKTRLQSFNSKWKEFYGWELFKTLSTKDSHHLDSLHIPANDNPQLFGTQILSITKILIDSLNQKELTKGISIPPKTMSIGKLELFLKKNNSYYPEIIEYLKNLQRLRSGLVAHRYSESNKELQKAFEFFDLSKNGERETLKNILIKCIQIMNTLESNLLPKEK